MNTAPVISRAQVNILKLSFSPIPSLMSTISPIKIIENETITGASTGPVHTTGIRKVCPMSVLIAASQLAGKETDSKSGPIWRS